MTEDDSTYFTKRAEAELEQAQRAARPRVAQVHQQLAEAYLVRMKAEVRPAIEQAP